MEQKIDHSKRPEDSDFKQQRLKAWQPLLTPGWVILTFLVIGVVFIPIGAVIMDASNKVVEFKMRYDNNPKCQVSTNLTAPTSTCDVTMTVDQDMTAPVYFYYQLTNFYQNHRRYVKSRSDSQLRGTLNTDEPTCEPIETGFGGKTQYACGLIAYSYFNDTFSVNTTTSGNSTTLPWTDKGIAWSTDVDKKFKDLGAALDTTKYTRKTRDGVQLPTLDDEAFIVWMRTAGLPTFKKLRYIIHQDIKAGTQLTFTIGNNYPVSGFDGEKHIVLSTTSWLGGKNEFLGWAYIIVGAVCLLLAAVFFAKAKLKPRRLGDMQYFTWSNAASGNQ
eukprot:TRINITY_DN66022_c2_g1_i1.p1 TRINITY_DN66022_c2_g1~~TRINITY_DN66022_c2_g1_i1.p1  ORF type:complete len:330 (+),score=175.78 TRINITY_DN66022_c2_g1_i1:126-1115(+)